MTSPLRFDAVVFGPPVSEDQAAVATAAPRLRLDVVMTHAGHSCVPDNVAGPQAMAEV